MVKGSDRNKNEPNPILDKENPTPNAGVHAIIEVGNLIDSPLNLDPPHATYTNRWGPNAPDTTTITASWLMTKQDVDDQPLLRFDVTDEESPITTGMDVKSHSITDKI